MRQSYSYRSDPAVPPFDDSRPLFIFDGICVLCSGGVGWIMRHDPHARIAFTDAQGPVGQAIYRHYGLDFDDTYLFLAEGQPHTLIEGYFEVARVLGGVWRLAGVFRLIPRPLRDAFYRLVARNRYRWFGTAGHCALLTPEQRARLL
ncbi:MAG TPA: DCC1-like thiol-disulfide oxidoreductase family protein [Croceibacterium sp.]